MKNLKITLLLGASCLLSACQATSNHDKSAVVATYNGGTVTVNEAQTEINKLILKNEKLKGLTFKKLPTKQKELIIKEAATKELLYKEAQRLKLDQDEHYLTALHIFKTEFLQQQVYAHLIKEATTTDKVKALYKKMVQKLKNKKEVKVRYMLLENKKEADKLYKKLKKNPKNFAYYAKNKSLDKKTAEKGGDLGFVLEDILPGPVRQALTKLKKGTVSKPIALQDKWVLVTYDQKRKAQIPTYIQAKDEIKKNLSLKAIKDFTSKKVKEANIKMNIN